MSEEAKVSIECQKNEWLAAGAKEEDLVVMGDSVVSKVDFSNPSAAVFRDVSPMPNTAPNENNDAYNVFYNRIVKLTASAFRQVKKAHPDVPPDPGSVGKRIASQLWQDEKQKAAPALFRATVIEDQRPVIKLNILDTRYHKSDRISRDTQFWVGMTFPGGFHTRDATLWNNESEARNRAQHIANMETAFRFVIDDGLQVRY